MAYHIEKKCIHNWKQISRWKEGKVFKCAKCQKTIQAKENKPRFTSDMRLIEYDEEETGIRVDDKKKPGNDT